MWTSSTQFHRVTRTLLHYPDPPALPSNVIRSNLQPSGKKRRVTSPRLTWSFAAQRHAHSLVRRIKACMRISPILQYPSHRKLSSWPNIDKYATYKLFYVNIDECATRIYKQFYLNCKMQQLSWATNEIRSNNINQVTRQNLRQHRRFSPTKWRKNPLGNQPLVRVMVSSAERLRAA